MLTLLSESHLWTFRDDVRIKNNDYGAFRYTRQRELQQHTLDTAAAAKRDYTEKRNSISVLKNSKKGAQRRLKDNLKKLEELLKQHKIVHSQWRDATQILLLFANGIIAYICVDIYTGDILSLVFEKYFVGKLATDTITDAFFTRSHIVLAYNTNQLTVVHLQKQNQRRQRPEKISSLDPRIFHVIIPGPSERKLARHLTVNSSYDLFVIWTKSSQNEVYPWRPTLREADRANIHVFKLKDIQIESIAYCWSEHDPLTVDFLRSSESQILTVEEKVSRKGEISAEICSYEITSGRMQRSALTSIPTGTQICCFAFSPDQEKLFVGTIDRKICLHDLVQQTTKFVTEVDVIPTHCTWHCDSSIIMIANDRSKFQCFDLALTPIGNQLQSEDVTPSNLLDLSHYFTSQPTLLNIAFSAKPDLGSFTQNYAQTDCFLLLLYENGPIGVLRFFAGAGMRGDIHNSGLTADVIVDKYLTLNQLEKAANLLEALNWETYGAMCLISLHKIANFVFYRGEVRQTRIEILRKALKTFTDDLSEDTKDEFSDQVFDLKRRFFFFLLRKNCFVEAFEVALDIDDYDLFMDLYNVTKPNIDLIEFSAAAFSQAAAILHEEERANGTHVSLVCDFRSESACSQFSTSTDTVAHPVQRHNQKSGSSNPLKNYVPPLPSFKSKIFNAEMIKINIPKPELRSTNENIPQDVCDHRINQYQTNSFSASMEQSNAKSLGNMHTASASVIVSTLAALSSKSGIASKANHHTAQQTASSNGNLSNTCTSTSQLINNNQEFPPLEQTIGLPTVQSLPSSPYNLLPRSTLPPSTPQSNPRPVPLTSKPIQRLESMPFLQYATPAVIAEQSYIAPTQRNYNNLPISPYGYQPKFYQHPLVSGTIPSTSAPTSLGDHQKRAAAAKKPTISILSNTSNNSNPNHAPSNSNGSQNAAKDANTLSTVANKSAGGVEKNKVKFSDTVQVAVVPDIQRKDKPLPPKRNGYSRQSPRNRLMNPKKELADSLPLCHPHDDYLKDFNPLPADTPPRPSQSKSMNSRDERKASSNPKPSQPPSIKVVHFGVV